MGTICVSGVCFWGQAAAWAQSSSSLEDQILSGSYSSPTASSSAAPDSEVDAELPDPHAELKQQREEVESEIEEVNEAVEGPSSVPNGHILVVQYRFIHKAQTHEISPFIVGLQPADSFRQQVSWGFSYAYHLTEDWGLEGLNLSLYKNYSTGLADQIKNKFTLFTDRKEPVVTATSAILWTPLKSKAATYEGIHYFEGYFLAGGGFTKLENRTAGTATFGLGFRAYMTQRSLFKVEVRNLMDFLGGKPTQRMNILVGASVLLGGEG